MYAYMGSSHSPIFFNHRHQHTYNDTKHRFIKGSNEKKYYGGVVTETGARIAKLVFEDGDEVYPRM
jgi:hypothetical protein